MNEDELGSASFVPLIQPHAVSGRSGYPEPGAARTHAGSQVLRGLHLLEPFLGLNAGVAAPPTFTTWANGARSAGPAV